MGRSRPRLSLALLTLCLAPLGEAFAQAKVDLNPYFLPNDVVGDFRNLRSENDETMLEELVTKETVGKKILYVFRDTVGDSVNYVEQFVVPGKKLLRSDYTLGEYDVDFGAPKTILPLKLVPGKKFRYALKGSLRYLGMKIGSVKIRGEVRFVGFEAHATPAFERENAARFERFEIVTMKPRGAPGPIFTTFHETTSWVTEDLATMGWVEAGEFYQDGELVEAYPPTEWWFESGVLGGEPVPAPPPE
jgi:hypothetical protein